MKTLKVMVLSAAVAASGSVIAGGGAHWGYEGHEGPEHWGMLSKEYATCSSGKAQSPINIKDAKGNGMEKIEFHYAPTPIKVVNNGHTIQVNYGEGSYMVAGGKRYELLQFHFHSPSENNIGDKPFDMEVHLVHKNKEGQLAVVGVMLKAGNANKVLAPVWKNMPAAHKNKDLAGKINAADLLPKNQGYYHFDGSLTTPPCSEGVKWFVMKDAIPVSAGQVKQFVKVVGNNARPVQPLNGRAIKDIN